MMPQIKQNQQNISSVKLVCQNNTKIAAWWGIVVTQNSGLPVKNHVCSSVTVRTGVCQRGREGHEHKRTQKRTKDDRML